MNEKLYKNKNWLIKEYETKSTLEIAKDVGISKQYKKYIFFRNL